MLAGPGVGGSGELGIIRSPEFWRPGYLDKFSKYIYDGEKAENQGFCYGLGEVKLVLVRACDKINIMF